MSLNSTRVLGILEYIAACPDGCTLRELADATGISRATAYRTVEALVDEGWLLTEGTPARFSASRRVAQLGLSVLRHDRVREAVLPNAIDLARAVGCVCMFAFYEGGDVVYTDAIEVFAERVMPTPNGLRMPAFTTACGTILLANQSSEEIDLVLQRAVEHPPPGLTIEPDKIRCELQASLDRGYAISRREYRETASGIAVGVFGRRGKIVAAVGVHAEPGVDEDFISRVLPPAIAFSHKASLELGHRSARRFSLP